MNKDIGYTLQNRYGEKSIAIYKKRVANRAAKLACELVTKWGMVAAVENGEDSSGRSKLRLATPEEMVKRACDTSFLLIEEMEKREWFLELPDPSVKKPVENNTDAAPK